MGNKGAIHGLLTIIFGIIAVTIVAGIILTSLVANETSYARFTGLIQFAVIIPLAVIGGLTYKAYKMFV